MPFGTIQLVPGVNTTRTTTLNSAGVSLSNLIRFRDGLPEKMGGWQRYVTAAMSSITKALHAWQDRNANTWLGVGSLSSLKVISNSAIQDITPQKLVTNPVLNLSTTVGGPYVTIIDTAILNVTGYDVVYFNTPVTIGGIILTGLYQIRGGAAGTTYQIYSGQVATATVANAGAVPSFTTVSGSSTVTVTFANHGITDGEIFYFPISTIVGGVTISGSFSASDATTNTFTINASTQATATATVSMNSGAVQYLYYLSVGPTLSTSSGALGPIGQFAVGEGFSRTASAGTQAGTAITATDWSLDNWGELLLACPKGGPIFYWQPGSGFTTAISVGSAPPVNNGIFVAMPQQILVALGSASTMVPGNPNPAINPLLVRWSDNEDFSEWQATTQTQAGSFLLTSGSRIVGGIQGPSTALIFTDLDVWTMDYIGYPLVFGFNKMGSGAGLIGQHAVTAMRGLIYWMGNNFNFYMTGGKNGVTTIPCPIWDTIFQDLDVTNAHKITAGADIDFDEVFWFYPSISGGTGENDKYIKVNVSQGVWDYGTLSRSAWVGRSVLGTPIGADPDTTYLQQHEMTYNADGSAMNSFYETGYVAVGDGENFPFLDHFEPDMKFTTVNSSTPSATLTVTISATNFPTQTPGMTSTTTMTSTTSYLTPRLRGRQMKWRVESNDLGSWWRQGLIRYRFSSTGRQ